MDNHLTMDIDGDIWLSRLSPFQYSIFRIGLEWTRRRQSLRDWFVWWWPRQLPQGLRYWITMASAIDASTTHYETYDPSQISIMEMLRRIEPTPGRFWRKRKYDGTRYY